MACRWMMSAFVMMLLMMALPEARAQSPAPAHLLGVWRQAGDGQETACRVELEGVSSAGLFAARAARCHGSLATVRGWAPDRNGFVLFDGAGRPVVSLTPARGLMAGRLPDGSLLVMRRSDLGTNGATKSLR